MRISKRDKRLLIEAYRRYNQFHQNEPLNKAWVILGTSSSLYKSKYFKCATTVTPNVLNWWTLSDLGVKMMKELLKLNTWSEMKELLKLNIFSEINGKLYNDELLTFPEKIV
jgi:hypothetical protein